MKVRLEHLYTGKRGFMKITKELLSRKDIATLCSVCTQTVIRWEADGKLTPIHVGERFVRYSRADVEKFLQGGK